MDLRIDPEWIYSEDSRLVGLYLRMRLWLAVSATVVTALIFLASRTPEAARLAVATIALMCHALLASRRTEPHIFASLLADATVVGLALVLIGVPTVTVAGLAFALAVSTLLLTHRRVPWLWLYSMGWAALSIWQASTPRSLPSQIQPPAQFVALLFFLGGLTAVVAVVTKSLRRYAREEAAAGQALQERQKELQAANARLSELIQSKDRFVASVSHELRTPLTAVVGLARELTKWEFRPEERAELQDIIATQATEVSDIVDDLLIAARREIGVTVHPVPCSVADIVQGVTSVVKVPIRLSVPGHVEAFADPLRLRQVIRNLLTNAQRYGGEHIELEAVARNGAVHIEVRDDGAGIAGEDAERIFEAYETTASPSTQPASIGLGLSVARTLARLMNGDVSYRRDGAWTVFALEVPSKEGMLLGR